MWSEAIRITIYQACETSLVLISPACEHRYTLPTVAPLVLASAGVVGDVSRPAILPHMLYIYVTMITFHKFAYKLYLFL